MSDRKPLKRPLNILHLIVTLPVGGIEQRLKELVIRYSKEEFRPIVCCLRDKNVVGREIEQYGIEVIELDRMRGHRFDPILVWKLYRLMKERRIDIVRMHEYHASLYGRLAARWAKVPVVIASVHNVYRRKLHHRFWINRFLARWSDRVIAISERVKEDLLRFDRIPLAKVKVIPNGVDPLLFENPISKEEARRKLSLPEQAVVIGTVGRLSIAKGHKNLLNAFQLLLDEGGWPDLRLVLVGEGPLRENLEQMVQKGGLEKAVLFLGTRRDVPDCLRAFDLFVFSSLWEGQPAAVIEAMAAGLPIVSTDYEGVREIITDRVEALLVRSDDPKALKEGMVQLLRDGTLSQSLGKAARRRVVGQLSVQRIVQEYETLYKELLSVKGFVFS
ncbi:MAG: glycosyltransferase [Candidatus Manganitrophus sp.]|nr:glycosyltransferase [Candidatus Manganitrophus sp.]MDC4223290.1 glycosyltransferase [Candidatus Manganitrophus sp.]WDT71609.1 MAG: glycosyltransferase [Candidatus Manganitrophus sp.]WDT81044.1 MAG: glycosyltransferase [Candidatus Manganitrophus sp.]